MHRSRHPKQPNVRQRSKTYLDFASIGHVRVTETPALKEGRINSSCLAGPHGQAPGQVRSHRNQSKSPRHHSDQGSFVGVSPMPEKAKKKKKPDAGVCGGCNVMVTCPRKHRDGTDVSSFGHQCSSWFQESESSITEHQEWLWPERVSWKQPERQGSAQVQVTEGPSPGLSTATGTRVTGIGVKQPPETVYPATNV